MAWKIADYVALYAALIVPVIPAGVTIAPNSKIPAASAGKVPGLLGEDGWHGIAWRTMEPVSLKRAQRWDGFGAGLGFRLTDEFDALDFDITWGPDCMKARAMVTTALGDLPLRIVDHPDHVKVLFFFRVAGGVVKNSDFTFDQADGKKGKIQLLAKGRYFNVHGTHPGRLKPYRWPNADPVNGLPPIVPFDKLIELMRQLRETFKASPDFTSHRPAGWVDLPPTTCTAEEAEFLIGLIPNDDAFIDYAQFVKMGAALYGASKGADWGRVLWLDWCDQVAQGDPDKPENFWSTMRDPRAGAETLRRWAQARQPQLLAQRDFDADPIDEDTIAQMVEDANVGESFLRDWFLVGGSTFYRMPDLTPHSERAFTLENDPHHKRLQRYFGAKGVKIPEIFVRHRRHVLHNTLFMPGGDRIVDRSLNLWTAPERPWADKALDQSATAVYLDLLRFVMGGETPASLWLKWHAFMLQHPSIPPGWHWLVQTETGLGKDLLLHPFAVTHGRQFQQITEKIIAGNFNAFSQKRIVSVSEMRERQAAKLYTDLKGLTSGTQMAVVRSMRNNEFMAKNVMGLVIFSNEEHPFKIPADDRRFYVVENLDTAKREPKYYGQASAMIEQHAAQIAEYCWRMKLTAEDLLMLRSNAPASAAKLKASKVAWEQDVVDMADELESNPTDLHLMPIATTSQIRKWLIERGFDRHHELPNRFEFIAGLYRIGVRPVVPAADNPKRPASVMGLRLWRLARTWRHPKTGVEWNIEEIAKTVGGALRLAKLHRDYEMPPPDITKVDNDREDEL